MATKKSSASTSNKRGKMNSKTAAGIGAGVLAAAAAAGAGYYFYGDKNAKKHRQAANKWAQDMKKEVMKEARKVKKFDKKAMGAVVDRAAAMYQGVRSVDASHLRAAAAELKRNWKEVERELSGSKTTAKKGKGTKTARKTTSARPKKSAKKTVKKARRAAKK